MRRGELFGYSFYLRRRGRFDLSQEFCFRKLLFNSSVVLNVKYSIFGFTIPIYHLLEKKIKKHMAKKNTEKEFLILLYFF